MHILMINFTADFSDEQYVKDAIEEAPRFANIDGLIIKHMLFNHETNAYGGCYMFETKAALEAYKASDIYKSILANPDWSNFHVSDFEVLMEASEIQEKFKV